jgi:hypothetical protein
LFVDVGLNVSLVVLLVDLNTVKSFQVETGLILTTDQNFGGDLVKKFVQPLPDHSRF